MVWPDTGRSASSSRPLISASLAPSNTGVAIGTPSVRLRASSCTSASVKDAMSSFWPPVVVDALQELAQLRHRLLRLEHLADLGAEAARGPAEVGLEDLADVHARGHAERVQHDVDRAAVR